MSDRHLEFMSKQTWLLPAPNLMLPFTSNLNRSIISDPPVAQSPNSGSSLDSLFLTHPTSNPLPKPVSLALESVLMPVCVSSAAPTPHPASTILKHRGTFLLVSPLPLLFLYLPNSSLFPKQEPHWVFQKHLSITLISAQIFAKDFPHMQNKSRGSLPSTSSRDFGSWLSLEFTPYRFSFTCWSLLR